jgi:transposase-like protein
MAHTSVPQVDRSTLLAMLAEQAEDAPQDLLRMVFQAEIQPDFEQFVGVDRYVRSDERRDCLRLALFEYRRRNASAPIAAVQEMVINGGSTRKVENVLEAQCRGDVQVAGECALHSARRSGEGVSGAPALGNALA